jgi:hypothetical protein
MEQIILWECNFDRIHHCEAAIYEAMNKIGLKTVLIVNSEVPLLSRAQIWERLPVLEIRGQFWSCCPGRAFTTQEIIKLFVKIFS